jgi:hypothetical protein
MNRILNVSTNPNWTNKPVEIKQPDGTSKFYNEDGKEIYIGYGWQNIEANYQTIFNLITINGGSIAPALNPSLDKYDRFQVSNKCNANVKSHSLIMVDIDDGMTIEELTQNPMYEHYGSGYYTTPNHTEAAPRFRIIFVLEEDICNADDIATMYRYMIRYWGKADGNCIDASRSFNGCVNAVHKEITTRTLPAEFVRRALLEQSKIEYKPPATIQSDYETTEQDRALIINKLKGIRGLNVPEIAHNSWITLGFGLKAGGYSLQDFIDVSAAIFNSKSAQLCKNFWNNNNGKSGKSIGMGTVVMMIKDYYGDDWYKV